MFLELQHPLKNNRSKLLPTESSRLKISAGHGRMELKYSVFTASGSNFLYEMERNKLTTKF
jgi:hypothetical protein